MNESCSSRDHEGVVGGRGRKPWRGQVKRPLLRQRQAPLRARVSALIHEINQIETRERQRMATHLHDELGPLLLAAQLQLGELRQGLAHTSLSPSTPGPALGAALEALERSLDQAQHSARATTYALCQPFLPAGCLSEALSAVVRQAAERGRLRCEVWGSLGRGVQPTSVQQLLCRVLRELCLNVQKHAQATTLVLRLQSQGSRLCIELMDDGRGFQAPAGRPRFSAQGGFGLSSVQAQVEALGGCVNIHSRPGTGTSVRIQLDEWQASSR